MNEAVMLCDDLIFVSRVAGTAKALGLTLRSTKSARDLLIFCKQAPPRCVIINLNAPELDIDSVARELAQLQPRPTLVGYGSHVDAATLKKGRAAGLDVVWPRSKFVEELESALPGWAQSPESTS
jgi:DNA-binding NarL/FixJ family response regulator